MLVASLTLPMLPAPNVFCNCQSPTILARALCLVVIKLDPGLPLPLALELLFLVIPFGTTADAAWDPRTERDTNAVCSSVIVGGCESGT
jgi:hypothetical protein